MSILTKSSEDRLARLLAEVSWFADEIVVGVDEASDDATYEIASRDADVVFRFRHEGELGFARMLIFEYATSDWILVIDDDESFELALAGMLPDLLSDPRVTHYWFPRKWVVNERPFQYAFAPPWFPDWQLRLFRNDRRLVWKPARPHSGYHVLGPGIYITAASLLHYEPVWCTPDVRERKLAGYERAGAIGAWRTHYDIPSNTPCRPATPPPILPNRRARGPVRCDATLRLPAATAGHSWAFQILCVDIVETWHAGEMIVAVITLVNTGSLTWMPGWGVRSATLLFTHHLYDAQNNLLEWDCERSLILSEVRPGEQCVLIHQFRAPQGPGDYCLAWDMVSEGESWFSKPDPRSIVSQLHIVEPLAHFPAQ